ncbi:MAG: cobalamin biosynthesis protein [Eubacterium sp.]|nr:cobalamin biosynthesis protein [Eubacterium sp.]
MKINGICFSKDGIALAERIQKLFEETPCQQDQNAILEWHCKSNRNPDRQSPVKPLQHLSLHEWTEAAFADSDVLIFIAALGIAVRAIAPFVRDKRSDPAVLVLDEKGTYCIAVLSGHIGGANYFTKILAEKLGCIPVITTATDIHGKFAVDVYAKEHDYVLSSMTYAKEVSAALIGGESVGFYTPFPIVGSLPEGVVWSDKLHDENASAGMQPDGITLGIFISPSFSRAYFDHTLWLIPRCLTLGIGCKKGTSAELIEEVAREMLDQNCYYQEAVSAVASIDLKENEPGLLQFCIDKGLPLHVYTAEELMEAEGEFTGSDFVAGITGVDNVCERAAVLDSGNGKLVVKKYARDGVTCALAITDWTVEFDAS